MANKTASAPVVACVQCGEVKPAVGVCGGCLANICGDCVIVVRPHCKARVPFLISHPVVGMPATKIVGTDWYPCVVAEVAPRKIGIIDCTLIDGELIPINSAQVEYATLRNDGSWREIGQRFVRISIGAAGSKRDPHI